MWRVCGPSAGWGVACHWVLRLVRALGTSNARACCGLSWYAADAGSAGCCEHHVCGVYTYDLRLTKSTLASHSRLIIYTTKSRLADRFTDPTYTCPPSTFSP